MYRSQNLSLISIWYKFEEDPLKTLLCRVHSVKNEVGPLVATNVTNGWAQYTEVYTVAQWTFGVN